jgi:hypothetical protein
LSFFKKAIETDKKAAFNNLFGPKKAFSLLPEKVAEVFGLYRINFQKTVGYFFFKAKGKSSKRW